MNEELFEDNIKLISEMDTASGSVMKMLLMTVCKNGNDNIELKFKKPKMHSIEYTIVNSTEAKKTKVIKIAKIIGIKITNTLLKVGYE